MSILYVFLILIVIGICLWLVNAYVPMDAKIKKILNIVAVVIVVMWLLKVFGVWSYLSNVSI